MRHVSSRGRRACGVPHCLTPRADLLFSLGQDFQKDCARLLSPQAVSQRGKVWVTSAEQRCSGGGACGRPDSPVLCKDYSRRLDCGASSDTSHTPAPPSPQLVAKGHAVMLRLREGTLHPNRPGQGEQEPRQADQGLSRRPEREHGWYRPSSGTSWKFWEGWQPPDG